jgi:(p)ppGpp synthase/HD superfamily hydrolase
MSERGSADDNRPSARDHGGVVSTVVEQAGAFIDDVYAGADEKGLAHSHEVGDLLAALGGDDELVAAGLLHDVVEDTGIALDDVRAAFGDRIADLVGALTEDTNIPSYPERKQALREAIGRAGPTALAVSAADKVARLRAADRRGTTLPARKVEHYQRTLETLAAHGIHTTHTDELRRRLRAHDLRRRGRTTAAPALRP